MISSTFFYTEHRLAHLNLIPSFDEDGLEHLRNQKDPATTPPVLTKPMTQAELVRQGLCVAMKDTKMEQQSDVAE